ncbi:MAG: hypothetical protein H6678_04005 [Candidatus Delongbacteria bacterium]|nr:hypothetical protein [Candidatus Cloacimonadota bacterium]MCB9472959.1 hypothetical protein [Candidatus Delongbacteria bacterium]
MDLETAILWYVCLGGVATLKRVVEMRQELVQYSTLMPFDVFGLLLLVILTARTVLWLPLLIARGLLHLFPGRRDS